MNPDPTQRFTNRVVNYIRYRPSYPGEMIDFMVKKRQLTKTTTVADIGSGTGKLTELMLPMAYKVIGVEPNDEMRWAAEKLLADVDNFESSRGRAENTGLPEGSVDLITVAQAFHWFDQEACRKEFKRILKQNGQVLLIWNDRLEEASEFMQAYDRFVAIYSTNSQWSQKNRKNDSLISHFFGSESLQQITFLNLQSFTLEALKGRYLSSSYALGPGHPQYQEAITALEAIFENTAINGLANMFYRTYLYYGKLT